MRGKNMKMQNLCTYLILMATSPVVAQQPDAGPARGGRGNATAGLPSPVINADHTVIFRVRAADAKSVSLTSDFQEGNTDLVKGDDGVWSATVGPLQPDIYYYNIL